MSSHESSLRDELVRACKVLYAAGAVGDGLGGHLSARLGEDRILIKPRPTSWLRLQPEDLIVIDFNGRRADGPPDERSSVLEWPIHARIYAARADIHCVLHAHPAASTLMASLGIDVEPLNQDCAPFVGRLPVLDNGAASISTVERGDQVAQALGNMRVMMLKYHGSIVVGAQIASVCVAAHKLERVAETMLRAASIASLPIVPPDKKAAILHAREAVEPSASGGMDHERWQMMQAYLLDDQN